MKLILHIGQHKTGTTALQDTLHADRARLRALGILYPEAGRDHRPDGSARNNHNGLFFAMEANRVRPGLPSFQSLGEAVRSEIETAQPERIVISAEHAFLAADMPDTKPLVMLDALIPGARDVVAYLRRPDRYLESWQRQLLRGRMTRLRPLHDPQRVRRLMKTCHLDYVRALRTYWDRYGSVRLFNYETIDDTVANFYSEVLGVDPPARPSKSTNPSIPAVMANLAHAYAREHDGPSPAQLRALVRFGDREPVDLLGPVNRRRIYEFFEPQNRLLGELYGERVFFWDLGDVLEPPPDSLSIDIADKRYRADFEAIVSSPALPLRDLAALATNRLSPSTPGTKGRGS